MENEMKKSINREPSVSNTTWAKMQQIETFVGHMNNNSELIGERKKLLVIHECGDDKEALIGQLEEMIRGIKTDFDCFGC